MSGTDSYIVGGFLSTQENQYAEAFEQAKADMIRTAKELGADAVVGTQASVLSAGTSSAVIVIVSGTAVRLNEV